ncbi:MAG: ComEC/Rec2 family competence protein [Bacteroidales bacterium]|nr:ComEC/Rec2 family competence protein [Bacteroidales bacterium]
MIYSAPVKADLNMVVLSVPFLAGAIAAAALGAGPAAGSVCLAGAACCLAAMALRKGHRTWLAALLFLLLGAFTWSSRNVQSLPAGSNSPVLPDGMPEMALERLSAVIRRIPFPHRETNALLLALITGRRELLDRATVQSFRQAGAAHILALSGLHLGIIYLILSKLFLFLGNSGPAWIIRSCIIVLMSGFYTMMTGAGPSTVRAFLFICLNEIARNCPGRRKPPAGVLCTALLIQLCARPSVLFSAGFQLSYLAMLGIFLIYPRLRDWYPPLNGRGGRWDPVRRTWESMAMSLSCQVFTAPLVWLRFHTFPKYFLLSNLISLPLTGLLISGGLACTVLEAAKTSPRLLARAVDWLAMCLRNSLETVSSM